MKSPGGQHMLPLYTATVTVTIKCVDKASPALKRAAKQFLIPCGEATWTRC